MKVSGNPAYEEAISALGRFMVSHLRENHVSLGSPTQAIHALPSTQRGECKPPSLVGIMARRGLGVQRIAKVACGLMVFTLSALSNARGEDGVAAPPAPQPAVSPAPQPQPGAALAREPKLEVDLPDFPFKHSDMAEIDMENRKVVEAVQAVTEALRRAVEDIQIQDAVLPVLSPSSEVFRVKPTDQPKE